MDELTRRRIRELASHRVPMAACLKRATDWRLNGRNPTRGTILVASTDAEFVRVVGALVDESGFLAAYPTDGEAPWLSVTRTQPSIAICDCEIPVERIQRLVFEAWARHVPVLVSTTEQYRDARALKLPHVAHFSLPVSYEVFCSIIESLLPSIAARRTPRKDEPRGRNLDAAIDIRILPTVARHPLLSAFSESARVGHSDEPDN